MCPSAVSFVFSDTDQFEASFQPTRLSLLITNAGRFRASLTRVELFRLELLDCQETLPRIAHARLGRHNACMVFPTSQSPPARLAGQDTAMGDVMFFGPEEHFHMRVPPMFNWGLALFKLKDLGQRSTAPDIPYGCSIVPPHPILRRLLRLHRTAIRTAMTAPDLVCSDGPAGELEHELIEVLSACTTGSVSRKARRSSSGYSDLMNRFEDLESLSQNGLLRMSAIEAMLGVPGRTLRMCCQKHLGMSPHRYDRLRRLNAARSALLRSSPDATTVQAIAIQCGFRDLGWFASLFRETFGELPSTTLRRSVDS